MASFLFKIIRETSRIWLNFIYLHYEKRHFRDLERVQTGSE